MTTATYNTPIDHTSDAGFRAWGLALSNALQSIGLVKSADTGQIDWTTVNRPGTNTVAGYEIRYLDDSLHSTAPAYIKIEYGTQSSATVPLFWVTVGTATNGAGTITGAVSTRSVMGHALALASTVTNYPTYLCKVAGYVGVAFKSGAQGGSNSGLWLFAIQRTVDAAGAPTADGFGFTYTSSANAYKMFCFDNVSGRTPAAASAAFVFSPMSVAPTITPPQFSGHTMYLQGRTYPCQFTLSCTLAQQADGSTFTTRPVEATDRTFIQPGLAGRHAATTDRLCLYWN